MSRTLARIRETVGDPIFVQAGRKMDARRARSNCAAPSAKPWSARRSCSPRPRKSISARSTSSSTCARTTSSSACSSRLLEEMARDAARDAALHARGRRHRRRRVAQRPHRPVHQRVAPPRPEIRVQPLFTTTFVGLARDDHPIFDDDITPERFARWPHRRVAARQVGGPIDDALAARGLARQVLLVVPTPYAAIFALQASDRSCRCPSISRAARCGPSSACAFELPVPLETVLITQAWHPRFQSDPRTSGCDVSCAGCAPASRRCIRRTHDACVVRLVDAKTSLFRMHRS